MSAPGKEWIDYDPERQKARARGLLEELGLTREIVMRVVGPPPMTDRSRRIVYWRSVINEKKYTESRKAEARRILEKLGASA